jgi:hypothetical protein
LLIELLEYKAIYQELTSKRGLDTIREFLITGEDSAKANIYVMLCQLVLKYRSNEQFQKKISIDNFRDDCDELVLEEDQRDVFIMNNADDSEFFAFIKEVVTDCVAKDLKPLDDEDDTYQTSYGYSKAPFGIVRMRAVEFLNQAYQVFFKDLHPTMAETDLYNSLLYFFGRYPFHNVLHA